MVGYTALLQSQKAISAYFTSEQILPFGFAEQYNTTWASVHGVVQFARTAIRTSLSLSPAVPLTTTIPSTPSAASHVTSIT